MRRRILRKASLPSNLRRHRYQPRRPRRAPRRNLRLRAHLRRRASPRRSRHLPSRPRLRQPRAQCPCLHLFAHVGIFQRRAIFNHESRWHLRPSIPITDPRHPRPTILRPRPPHFRLGDLLAGSRCQERHQRISLCRADEISKGEME